MWLERRIWTVLSTIVAAMALLTLPAVLAGCGSSGSGTTDSSSVTVSSAPAAGPLTAAEKEWLAQKGTLQIGAFSDYPPFGFVDESGQAVGIAADYWKLVAERLGVEVAFTPLLFADQLEGLKQGRFDSLQGIFPVPERAEWFAFSRAYCAVDTHIYTDAAHTDRATLESLKGLQVAVVDGDSGQQLATDAGLSTVVVKGYPQAVEAVASGAAQAMILDELVAEYYIGSQKVSDKVKVAGEPVASGQMTMPVLKDDTVLLGILNKGIGMVEESEFQAISEKWMGQ